MDCRVTFLAEMERKILMLEGPDGVPDSLNLVIPSLTRPGIPFDIKVAVYDEHGFPATRAVAKVGVKGSGGGGLDVEISFTEGEPAVARIGGVVLGDEGVFRFEGMLGGRLFHSNPTRCSSANTESIWWGDPHIHTNLSNCHPERCRSLNYCFTAARHSTGLDWASAADHVSNGRCEYAKWKEQTAVANLFNEPGKFVTLPCFEASLQGGCGGDNNVYMTGFPDLFVDEYDGGNVATLADEMKGKMSEDDFIVVPHHTTRTGKHGEIPDAIYPGEAMMPVVEIHSKWGTSEYRGNPNPLKKVHDGPSYAVDLLNQGLPLGFIGGTDSHCTLTTGRGRGFEADHIDAHPGMTAVFANSLERSSLVQALKERRCYAASLDRSLVMGTVNGQPFGTKMENCKTRRIQAAVAGKTDIESVDIVRNGETVHTFNPNDWRADIDYVDEEDLSPLWLSSKHIGDFVYYYVRATFGNGARAWSSPAFVLAGCRT